MFSDNREKYLGYAEAATGIGLMIGPVLGGFLFVVLGYFGSFVAFAIILLIAMIATSIITPGALNDSVTDNYDNMTVEELQQLEEAR